MIKSAEEFVRLRESDDMDEQDRASREEASMEVWLDVIERYPDMREWVAHNKTIPNEILEILSNDQDSKVRYMVSTRRSAGEKILEKLSDDTDESIRHSVACNPKVTKKILVKLLNDPWENIRISAENKLRKYATSIKD